MDVGTSELHFDLNEQEKKENLGKNNNSNNLKNKGENEKDKKKIEDKEKKEDFNSIKQINTIYNNIQKIYNNNNNINNINNLLLKNNYTCQYLILTVHKLFWFFRLYNLHSICILETYIFL